MIKFVTEVQGQYVAVVSKTMEAEGVKMSAVAINAYLLGADKKKKVKLYH